MRMSSWGVREVVFFSNPERRRSHCPELEHNGIQIHLHAQDSILVYNELEVNIVDSQDPASSTDTAQGEQGDTRGTRGTRGW